MRKFMCLLMLLLLSSNLICQTTNTNLTKCFSPDQVSEIFRGLKQGDYLKARLEKTENSLQLGTTVISEQKSMIIKQAQIITGKDEIIANNKNIYDQNKEIFSAQKERLESTLQLNKQIAKHDGQKKFWKGIKIGGFSVAVMGVAAILILK